MAKKGPKTLREEEIIIISDSEKAIKEAKKAVDETNIALREVAMSTKSDAFKRLEESEKHWNALCKKFETTEMSKDDAEKWRLRFQTKKDHLMIQVTRFDIDEFNQRVDRVEDKLEVAILKAKANFREKEKIRLKEAYGFLGALFYLILKIAGKF